MDYYIGFPSQMSQESEVHQEWFQNRFRGMLMKWMPEAEEAIKKVPFFVRKKVKARVEKEAKEAGKPVVSLADVKATQARYLTSMSSEIKGYQIETCFGPSG
jgi:anaerobic sulfite reductase subunit C